MFPTKPVAIPQKAEIPKTSRPASPILSLALRNVGRFSIPLSVPTEPIYSVQFEYPSGVAIAAQSVSIM